MMKRRRKRTDGHLTHCELQAAAREKKNMTGHLKICDDCREAVELLRLFPMAGRVSLNDPPESWVKQAVSIPMRSAMRSAITHLKALLTFDSWLSPQPVGVRGMDSCSERRICCEAGAFLVDLRAEKCKDGWRMVAQLVGEKANQAELSAGSKTVPADHSALFQWSSTRPPSVIHIRVGEQDIELPKLLWKRPRKT